MTEQPNQPREPIFMRERILAILLVIGLACVFAMLVKPELAALSFLVVCLIAIAGVAIYRSGKVAGTKRSAKSDQSYLRTQGRDAMILRSFAQALQHPAYILNRKSNVFFANAAAQKTFGEIRTNEWIFVKFRQPILRHLIEKAIKAREPQTMTYNEAVPKDRWFAVEVAPIPRLSEKDPSDEKLYLLSFHDLTDAKRTEKMRSDFIANASHELRTPLASLLGYIETIKGPARNDAKAFDRFTDIMLVQAQRMTRLVNDLLSLSRIEMKSHVEPSDLVNLTEIVSSVVVSLEGLAQQLGITIAFEMPAKILVKGDRDELLQVFENLIENACKYGQDGGRIVVGMDLENIDGSQSVRVFVQDFGPGISFDEQSRITERFYRVDVARSREKQGTGLGLAIVKHILNRHGTRLNIQSIPGEGAVFSVSLPVEENNKVDI